MTCQELLPVYDAYALGVADEVRHEEILRHLKHGCGYCAIGLASARYTVEAMAGLAEFAEPPARLRRRVMSIVSRDGDGRGWFAKQLPWAIAAALAFALLMNVAATLG